MHAHIQNKLSTQTLSPAYTYIPEQPAKQTVPPMYVCIYIPCDNSLKACKEHNLRTYIRTYVRI